MPEQIVIVDAGLPGKPNSYYSEEITLATTPGAGSPIVAGRKTIPNIGWILFEALPSGVEIDLALNTSPVTYVTLVAAGGPGQTWSDGTNVSVKDSNAVASPPTSIKYFVLAEKP